MDCSANNTLPTLEVSIVLRETVLFVSNHHVRLKTRNAPASKSSSASGGGGSW